MMNKLNETANKAAIYGVMAKDRVKGDVIRLLTKKEKGVDGIVVALILIVIAVGVGVLFHKTILSTLQTTLQTAKTEIDKLFSGVVL